MFLFYFYFFSENTMQCISSVHLTVCLHTLVFSQHSVRKRLLLPTDTLVSCFVLQMAAMKTYQIKVCEVNNLVSWGFLHLCDISAYLFLAHCGKVLCWHK